MSKTQKQADIFSDNTVTTATKFNRFRKSFMNHQPNMTAITEPSQTIPGMHLTIAEMLRRTAQGLPINGAQVPVWNGERLLPKWKDLDLIDRQKVIADTNEKVETLKKKKESIEKLIQTAREKALKKKEEVNEKPESKQPKTPVEEKGEGA